MATQSDRLAKLEKTVYGNGETGMDENVRNLSKDMEQVKDKLDKIENHTGPTHSDLKALKRAIFQQLGLDALGNPKQYDQNNHPGRRSEDQQTLSDKVLHYVVDRILPQVIVWAILGSLAFWIAVNNHLIIDI